MIARSERYRAKVPYPVQQLLATTCSAFYIMVLMVVNLIGYSIGVANVADVVGRLLFTRQGLTVLAVSFYFLCWGVQLMAVIENWRSKQHAA